MSGETHRDDDDLEFLDEFVLEDSSAELESLFDDEPTQADPRKAKDKHLAADPDEEDVLFSAGEQTAGDEGFATEQVAFTEGGGHGWRGARMEAEEIGIPVEGFQPARDGEDDDSNPLLEVGEEFAIDSDSELELVEDEAGLLAAETVEDDSFAFDEEEPAAEDDGWAEPAAASFEDPAGAEEQVDPDWAPVAAEGLEHTADQPPSTMPDWGAQEAAMEAAEGQQYADAATEEMAEMEIDATEFEEPVLAPSVVAPRRRGRVLRFMSRLAAAVLVVGAAGTVIVRPDWFGLSFAPEMGERIHVARPEIGLRIAAPGQVRQPTLPPVVTTDPLIPPPVVITDPPPVILDPPPVVTDPPPVILDPRPVVIDPQPVTGTDPIVTPTPDGPNQPVQGGNALESPLMQAGDSLLIGGFSGRDLGDVVTLPGVMPGSRAFAQLHNGNFFVGSVKSISRTDVTLRMETGEIVLPMQELKRIAALGSADYAELQKATSGFIRLTNNNRLAGSILETVADDHVILEMKADRVLLPRSAIEEIVEQRGGNVRFVRSSEEEQWLDRISERRLGQIGSTPAVPPPPPTPK